MYVIHLKINRHGRFLAATFSNCVTIRHCVYEKLQKQPLQPLWVVSEGCQSVTRL